MLEEAAAALSRATQPDRIVSEDELLAALNATQPDTVTELLERVRDFHYGRGKFNFSHLSDDQRYNVSFDAWQIIQGEIDAALAASGNV